MIKTHPVVVITAVVLLAGLGMASRRADSTETLAETKTNPALSVNTVQASELKIPVSLHASGSIAAWQEAVIGADVEGLRLREVSVQVGETVRKGQVLAVFNDDSVLADVAQSKAALAEAEANLAEARLNAGRAKKVAGSGVLSEQQTGQYLTTEKTAAAKVQSAKAQLDSQLLRLKHTRVLASDDGVISARNATLGAVAMSGQELFRLLRQHRLEWRAELNAEEMVKVKPGVSVAVNIPHVAKVTGNVRHIAPTLDPQSRNGLVYVDLPDAAKQGLRVGMFAEGEFYLGDSPALVVPQEALSLREGFSYVFRLNPPITDRATVSQIKVQLGRHSGNDYEILSGVSAQDHLVASGAAFLADGDTVRVLPK